MSYTWQQTDVDTGHRQSNDWLERENNPCHPASHFVMFVKVKFVVLCKEEEDCPISETLLSRIWLSLFSRYSGQSALVYALVETKYSSGI